MRENNFNRFNFICFRNELKQRFGIRRAFLATHSGLMRWLDFHNETDTDDFITSSRRSIDEIWYKRAVEQHHIDPQSYVFSVPFNSGQNDVRSEDIIVTASHAVFHTEDKRSAPVAVVGFQFQHSAFFTFFKNITSNVSSLFVTIPNVEYTNLFLFFSVATIALRRAFQRLVIRK